MEATEQTYRPNQRVTDCEGNRATFLRMAPEYTTWLNAGVPQAIVRYVGDPAEYVCNLPHLEAGWK